MQDGLAVRRGRLGAFPAGTRLHLGRRLGSRLSSRPGILRRGGTAVASRWIAGGLLAVAAALAGLGLAGLRSSVSELAGGVRENARAIATLHADVLRSSAGLEEKIADLDRKVADLAAAFDDARATRTPPARTAGGKGNGVRETASRHGDQAPKPLTVHRGRDR